MPEVFDFYPLPFDEELREAEKNRPQESLQAWYDQASAEASGVIWEKK